MSLVKRFSLLAAILVVIGLQGCAVGRAPVTGFLFSNVSGPIIATANPDKPTKVGKSSAKSVLGLIARGDASIEAAMKNGGITKIHHVDYKTTVLFGVLAQTTTIVYGD